MTPTDQSVEPQFRALQLLLQPGASDTLILHWNGSAWSQVASPSPSSFGYNFLYGVSAVSGGDAWAVGYYKDNTVGSYDTH